MQPLYRVSKVLTFIYFFSGPEEILNAVAKLARTVYIRARQDYSV